jgi:glycosyltransferase involved in cell wall biosynthesis
MTPTERTLLLVYGFIIAIWPVRHLVISWVVRRLDFLTPESPALAVDGTGTEPPPPLVTAIIPAKDEEATLAGCLASVCGQSYPCLEIVVVDDRSSDRTGTIAREFAHADPRVRVLTVTELPTGWTGKTHALHVAAGAARGDWFWFLDADTDFAPDNLAIVMEYARAHSAALVSLLPEMRCETFWECVVQPLASIVLMQSYPLLLVNSVRSKRAFANGQYILIRREAYEAAGGHRAVRDRFVEDIALAGRVKRLGFPIRVALARRLGSTRMYASLGQLVEGWSRILYDALGRTSWRLIGRVLDALVFSQTGHVALAAAIVLLARGDAGPFPRWLLVMSLVHHLLAYSVMRRVYRLSVPDSRHVAWYPLGNLVLDWILLKAVWLCMTGRVRWRGTRYGPRCFSVSPAGRGSRRAGRMPGMMKRLGRSLALPGMMLFCGAAVMAAPGLSGTWAGQDGHDLVGPSAEVKPNDVQDIHIVLAGLPPDRTIAQATVTAQGGGEWQYGGKGGSWAAAIERAPRSSRADLYLEPAQVETGRLFAIRLRYDDGSTAEVVVKGRRAAPDLRMPAAALSARWMGQEPIDWTGSEPGVGPDGLQDARLALGRLSARVEVASALIEAASGRRWRFGVNAELDTSAELVRDPADPARAELYFQPAEDLAGQRLRLVIRYASGKTDSTSVVAGATDPARRMPPVQLPRPIAHTIDARWLGQDGAAGGSRGDVHVSLARIPAGRSIAAAVLSDPVGELWVYQAAQAIPAGTDGSPLRLQPGADPTRAELFFAPVRDESATRLTLRIAFADGALAIVTVPGGACDIIRCVPETAGAAIDARPGDDLHALVKAYRTVTLAPGTYRLTRPLILEQPVTLRGVPRAVLRFEQAPGDPPWAAAITVHRSRTTLDGFAVRFAGPIRWQTDVPWGPALIGVTETSDGSHPDPRIGLSFTRLDLEAPPAASTSAGTWEDAPRLMRLVNARSGRIANNRLRGGMIELGGGPWEIVENEYLGTPPGTVSPAVIAAHHSHDLVVRRNRARPEVPSGKTWRFLVVTGSGAFDRVEENSVVGIGPRDDDTIPWANAPEIVLTEAYKLFFEGKPAAIAPDGRIISVGQGKPLGPAPRAGSVVAVVAGAQPGQWRKIAQVLDHVTFLLEEPLPPGTERIAVATGFIGETFARNTIDSRGGARAINLVLPGNHFGTQVLDNQLLGAGDAFQITAYPTEAPGIWGWSHVPFLDGLISGNTLEDAPGGGVLGVTHSEFTKSSRGRTYMTATLRDNTVKWSAPFLARQARGGVPPGLTIGFPGTRDAAELIVSTRNNRLDAPPGTSAAAVRVHAAVLNGRPTLDQRFTLATGAANPR